MKIRLRRDPAAKRLLDQYAASEGISERTAYRHREEKADSWVQWLSEREQAAAHAYNAGQPEESTTTSSDHSAGEVGQNPTSPPRETGRLGVEAEIFRLRRECEELARRRADMARANATTKELQLLKALNQTRETLRRLELSCEAVVLASGSYVQRDKVLNTIGRFISGLRTLIEALPRRIAGVWHGADRDELRELLEAEVHRVLLTSSSFELDGGAMPAPVPEPPQLALLPLDESPGVERQTPGELTTRQQM